MRHPVPENIVAAAKLLEMLISAMGREKIDNREVPQPLQAMGFTASANGIATRAFIGKEWVLKFDRHNANAHVNQDSIEEQVRYINDMRRNPMYTRYFPKTYKFGKVVVQECCTVDERLFSRYERQVNKIANLIGMHDVHQNNVGWRKSAKGYEPVFIDCGLSKERNRNSGAKERSWMV